MGNVVFSNVNDFQNAVNSANPGPDDNLTFQLKPGKYDKPVKLDYRKSKRITAVMHGVEIHSEEADPGQYTVDVTGENITLLCDEMKATGGQMGVLGIRGHNLEIISDLKGYITGNNLGGDLFGTNNTVKGLNFDGLGNVGMSAKGFPISDAPHRGYEQKFGWYPSHNWRITQCVFQNISPREAGDAGGGFRIIPHAKDVIVDNCLFRNIDGSALWGDHNQKGFEWYWNVFEDIQISKFGKALFLEIMDPDPNDTSGFVAKIAGNIFRRCNKHTLTIAASSGQNPGGIDVFGNIIEDGWPIIIGAMERTFERRWTGKFDQSGWDVINARLENIRVRNNVIRQTTSRNHIAMYSGPQSGLIEIDGNYYVTGHQYEYTRPNGELEIETVNEIRIAIGGDEMNIHQRHDDTNANLDKNAVTGPFPEEFPFPQVWDEIPIERTPIDADGLPVIDNSGNTGGNDGTEGNDGNNGGNNGGNTGGNPDPNGLPNVWIMQDFPNFRSDGTYDSDTDNIVFFAPLFLCQPGRYNIKGITVGTYPNPEHSGGYKYNSVLDAFNQVVRPKVEKEWGNIDFPVVIADSHRKKFDGQIEANEIYKIIQVLREVDHLNVATDGALTEAAHLVREIISIDRSLLSKLSIYSHYTFSPTHHNHRLDKLAYQYLKGLGNEIDFIEFDKSGAVKIDDKTFPKMADSVLDSEIGSLFKFKWNHNKPDFSGFIIMLGIGGFEELGFDDDFRANLKTDGSSNLQLVSSTFGNQKGDLYKIIEAQAEKAVKGELKTDTGSGGNGGGTGNPDPDELEQLKDKIQAIENATSDFVAALSAAIVAFNDRMNEL